MRRTVAVVETPLLAGQGLAAWLAGQAGFTAWVARDWQDAQEADVVLVDFSRGERHAQAWLEKAPRLSQPLVAIESEAHPLPERWRTWMGAQAILTMPVAEESLLATLRQANLPAEPLGQEISTTPAPCTWAEEQLAKWHDTWDGLYFQAPAAADDPPTKPDPAQELTRREREIARLIALGLSNREIGERLFVAIGTVRKHRENLMTKLEIRSALALTQWALAASLISPDEFALTTQTHRR